MPKGEYYLPRLGKPEPVSHLASEWFDWFLKEVESYQVKKDSIALWALGGAGFILKTPRSALYIDPYCGGSAFVKSENLVIYRMIPIPFDPRDIRKIDATIITHEDIDHLDENFIFPVARNTQCSFMGPTSVINLLESWSIANSRLVRLDQSQQRMVNDVTIIAAPSNDPYAETANTYLFETQGVRIFHSGDSFHSEQFIEIGKKSPVDLALINLGRNPPTGKWYNTPSEVIQIAQDLKAKVVVPMHWNLWSGTTENPDLVQKEIQRRKLDMKVHVLNIGERLDYPP